MAGVGVCWMVVCGVVVLGSGRLLWVVVGLCWMGCLLMVVVCCWLWFVVGVCGWLCGLVLVVDWLVVVGRCWLVVC